MVTVGFPRLGPTKGTFGAFLPHPCPAGQAGSGAAERGEITGGASNLKASLFHVLIRCFSQYPNLYLPGPTPRWDRGRDSLLQKGASRPQKTSGDKLCSSTFVLPLSQMGGLLPVFCFRLCSQLRSSLAQHRGEGGAPVGHVRACSESRVPSKAFPSWGSGSALPLLTLTWMGRGAEH